MSCHFANTLILTRWCKDKRRPDDHIGQDRLAGSNSAGPACCKEIKRHEVLGEIGLFRLEGNVPFQAGLSECELTAGKLIYLAGSAEHALRAIEDSSLLVTILLEHKETK